MKEVWKDVAGYDGMYKVSNLGNVMSYNLYAHKEPRLLKARKHPLGYRQVVLSKNGKVEQPLIHRLVAEAFIENPNGYEFVNHKDEDKANNKAENLEWCTKSYNATYSLNLHPERAEIYGSFFNGKGYRGKPFRHKEKVLQYDKNGNFIAEYRSVVEANKITGIKNCAIIACCTGKQKTAFGYIWKFA